MRLVASKQDPLENRNLSEQSSHADEVKMLRDQLHVGQGRDTDLKESEVQ